jgi:hypothetical protein
LGQQVPFAIVAAMPCMPGPTNAPQATSPAACVAPGSVGWPSRVSARSAAAIEQSTAADAARGGPAAVAGTAVETTRSTTPMRHERDARVQHFRMTVSSR